MAIHMDPNPARSTWTVWARLPVHEVTEREVRLAYEIAAQRARPRVRYRIIGQANSGPSSGGPSV
jgi:hypothetical protein